jgi:hypothetical protein
MVDSMTLRNLLPDEADVARGIPSAKWKRIFEKIKVSGEIAKLDDNQLDSLLEGLETALKRPDPDSLPNHLSALNAVRAEQDKREDRREKAARQILPRKRQEIRLREPMI